MLLISLMVQFPTFLTRGLIFFFFFCHTCPGIDLYPPLPWNLGVLTHWTGREVQEACIFIAHWAPQTLQLALASWKLCLGEVCWV